MQFKGGKGVAAMMGIYMATDIRLWFLAGAPGVLMVLLTKYVSLGSITYAVLLIVDAIFLYRSAESGMEFILLTCFLSIMTIIRHRGNIKRLLTGTERKLGQKESSPENGSN